MNKDKTILSLCELTGTWSNPYREAGYNVIQLDIQVDPGHDVRLFEYPGEVHGIIAQPPCTHFSGSGARWWKAKGDRAVLEGMSVVDACMRIIAITKPKWWVLENPVGRLKNWLGPYKMTFQPYEYAMFADDPEGDAYTKRTCLWGAFNEPEKRPYPDGPVLGSKMHLIPPGPKRANLRSQTAQGFARAFAEANP